MGSKLIENHVESMTWAWWSLFVGRDCISIWSKMMRPISLHYTNQIFLQAGTDEVAELSHARQVFTLTLSSSGQLVHRFRTCWQKKHQALFQWRLAFSVSMHLFEDGVLQLCNLFQDILKQMSCEFAYFITDFKYSPHRNLKAMQILKEKKMILLPIR